MLLQECPNFTNFVVEMSSKGSISRMSDECLMKQETVFSFYTQYQAVMRKFTLAGKTDLTLSSLVFPILSSYLRLTTVLLELRSSLLTFGIMS